MKTIIKLLLILTLANAVGGCAFTDFMCDNPHFNPGGLGNATFWFC